MTLGRVRSTSRAVRALSARSSQAEPSPRPIERCVAGQALDPTLPAIDLPAGRRLDLSAVRDQGPLVLGILNVTPDSFSDGGRYHEPAAAIERGLSMLEAGADGLDLGAESTRPASQAYGAGAVSVSSQEEIDRLLPVLEALRSATDLPLSVDTRKASVAKAALRAGADLINDVTGLGDPEMAPLLVASEAPVILMHLRGVLPDIQQYAVYDDVVTEVRQELAATLARAVQQGIDPRRVVLDPGLGFAKHDDHNLALLRHLDALHELGCPLLVGASRKRFIGTVTGAAADQRAAGSLATVAWALQQGAALVRVHDVRETRHFIDVYTAIARAAGPSLGPESLDGEPP